MGRPRSREVPPTQVIIDTNILLLVVVGHCDPSLIKSFKRTRSSYDTQDYLLVMQVLNDRAAGRTLVTTPHILTEVSNLLVQMRDPARTACRQVLAGLIGQMREHAASAGQLAGSPAFAAIGITDAAIEQLSGENTAVFTDDWDLGAVAEKRGAEVWNLRSLRSYLK